ncbi:MAG TPA: tyrosine-type recombinase/integrase, partial [Terriglobales bacterium]
KSTLDGYNDIFECHLKETLRSETLGGLTTSAARGLLEQIAADNELRKRTIANIKHFLSGVYTFARNHGHFNGANPITGLKLKIKRRDTPTFAYSLDYQRQMLAAVQLKPRAAMAIAGYAGLSRSELQGLRWEDRQDHELSVQRSVVEGVEKETKTEHRAAPVPIISELAIILDDYWNSLGRPKQGWMFPAGRGKNSMSMSNLYRRHIIDDLRKHNIPWHGWHAFRRGLATNLKEMGVDDMVIQRILRHGTAETTRKHYIKLLSPSVKKAMSRLDRKLKRDKHGTVKNDAA